MKVNIISKQLEVTEGIENAIQNKLNILDKYFTKGEILADVIIKNYGHNQKIEVTLYLDDNITLRQEEESYNFYEALNLVTKNLINKIRKIRDVAKNHVNSKKNFEKLMEYLNEYDSFDEIVKRKEIFLEPMSEEEAKLQLELIGHKFYVFLDGYTNENKIIYTRNDNDFGIMILK